MPLSQSAPRSLAHTRTIVLHGYCREDGLFDIEARLTDTKPYSFANEDRGVIEAGEPLHGMAMRMTIDDTMLIRELEAQTDYSPYRICPEITPNFGRLAGLRIGRGFLRAATERVGGTHGCTHLRELLQQVATVAFQTLYSVRVQRGASEDAGHPALLNTCYAFSADGAIAQHRWPEHYTGAQAEATLPG